MPRLLALHDPQRDEADWLSNIAELCRALGMELLILTVARSERSACRGIKSAANVLAGSRVPIDFDFVVGTEIASAAAHVARWRNCQFVAVPPENPTTWLGWLRGGDKTKQLLRLAEQFGLLLSKRFNRFSFPQPVYKAVLPQHANLPGNRPQ